jgi:hypothetical protein
VGKLHNSYSRVKANTITFIERRKENVSFTFTQFQWSGGALIAAATATAFVTVVQTATHRTVLHDDALVVDQQALQWTYHPAQIAFILVILI